MPPLTAEEFWARVGVGGERECWPWLRTKHSNGYGVIGRKKPRIMTFYAHRLAYEFVHGIIPDGLVVRHSCDNPPCCNPAHLSLGTKSDNARDAVARGRHYSPFSRAERQRHGFRAGGACKP